MKEIKIALDVGNTSIDCGCFIDKQLLRVKNLLLEDFSEENLDKLIRESLQDDVVIKIGLSCVVPRHQEVILNYLEKYATVVNITASLLPDLVIEADNRNELGADFICAYYGVLAYYKAPLIVFDLGSATKVMVINENKVISGVAIKPGINQSLQAMTKKIPHLPDIELQEPSDIIGHNTIEAIRAGVFYGELSNIKYYSSLLDEHYNMNSNKVISGGYARLFIDRLTGFLYEPNLVLLGINEIIDRVR